MKEYFSHDYSAREDEKIKNLIFKMKWEGYGLYWALIEGLYQNKGYMQLHYNRIAFELQSDEKVIKSIINDFGLFEINEENFFSISVLRRLKIRNDKSKKYSKNAKLRWDKGKAKDAIALPLQSDCNAIKVNKSKVNKSKLNNKKKLFYFDDEKLDYAFIDYIEMRKKMKKPPTEKAIELAKLELEKLAPGDNEKKIEILNKSTLSNWLGLFPLKDVNRKQIKNDYGL